LQVPGLAIGQADLDRAVITVAFDEEAAAVRRAARCEAHVVVALDLERRWQRDPEQQTHR
jgi:hypothetical protein